MSGEGDSGRASVVGEVYGDILGSVDARVLDPEGEPMSAESDAGSIFVLGGCWGSY